MSDLVVLNGITYIIPTPGEEDWGQNVTDFLVAIPAAVLQATGGNFTLTADANFGASFGLISSYYKSRSANVASAGAIRLANLDLVEWRNFANAGNNVLGVNASDQLTYNGAPLEFNALSDAHIFVGNVSNVATDVAMTGDIGITNTGVTAIQPGVVMNADINASAAIAYTKLNLAGSITNTDIYSSAAIAYSKLNLANSIMNADINAAAAIAYSKLALTGAILNSDLAGSIAYSKLILTGDIVNADIASAAAIAFTKLAALNNSIVPVTNGSGVITSSTTTATQLSYLDATSSIQTQLNGKQASLTIGNLTDVGTDGITVTNGTGAVIGTGTSLSQHVADTTHSGYLSSTDWNTFNGKQAAGSYITALTGDVTASGPGSVAATLATVNTNVGTFGSSTAIPVITVNGKGLVTAISTAAVVAPAGTLTGTTLASNVVSSSLTSVGTIATGVWNGTAIDVAHGGTGDTSLTAYAVLCGGTTTTNPVQSVAGLGASGQVLTSNGAGALPTFQTATGTGTVNSGTATHLAYYATSTNAVSDASGATVSGTYTFSGAVTHTATLTMSGATIAMGANKITGLANGTAATDAAAFGQIPVVSAVTAFTPTFVGLGTVSANTGFYIQIGKILMVWGSAKLGTTTATQCSMTIPTGALDTASLSASSAARVGTCREINSPSSPLQDVFSDDSDTTHLFFSATGTAGSGYSKQNGSSEFDSNTIISYNYTIPIV